MEETFRKFVIHHKKPYLNDKDGEYYKVQCFNFCITNPVLDVATGFYSLATRTFHSFHF